MKEEILIAKKILKDPNLCNIASRKFNNTVDKVDEKKFIVKGAVVTGLLPQEEDEMKEFECEIEKPKGRDKKLLPGTTVSTNADLPASSLTLKNQFKKLNYTHFTPNTIKIRQAGGRTKRDMNASVELPLTEVAEIRMSVQAQAASLATNRTRDKLSDIDSLSHRGKQRYDSRKRNQRASTTVDGG